MRLSPKADAGRAPSGVSGPRPWWRTTRILPILTPCGGSGWGVGGRMGQQWPGSWGKQEGQGFGARRSEAPACRAGPPCSTCVGPPPSTRLGAGGEDRERERERERERDGWAVGRGGPRPQVAGPGSARPHAPMHPPLRVPRAAPLRMMLTPHSLRANSTPTYCAPVGVVTCGGWGGVGVGEGRGGLRKGLRVGGRGAGEEGERGPCAVPAWPPTCHPQGPRARLALDEGQVAEARLNDEAVQAVSVENKVVLVGGAVPQDGVHAADLGGGGGVVRAQAARGGRRAARAWPRAAAAQGHAATFPPPPPPRTW
jgi:hypothetical protein